MTDYAVAAAVVVGAYFVGSIPTGVLFARARGIDLSAVGSGNIGATNVTRSLGKKLGLVVLLLDALKGAAPMVAVLALDLATRVDPFVVTATGFAAIAGHCFPVWLGFRGGKGVATTLGVFLVLEPDVIAAGVVVFALAYAMFRVSSVGSLLAAVLTPTLLWALGRSDASVTLAIAVAVLIIARHHSNISRLLQRREHRV